MKMLLAAISNESNAFSPMPLHIWREQGGAGVCRFQYTITRTTVVL
jgi:hypothetical protein